MFDVDTEELYGHFTDFEPAGNDVSCTFPTCMIYSNRNRVHGVVKSRFGPALITLVVIMRCDVALSRRNVIVTFCQLYSLFEVISHCSTARPRLQCCKSDQCSLWNKSSK